MHAFLVSLFFNGRLSNNCLTEVNGPIFTKISGLVDGCKGLFSSLSFFYFSKQSTEVEKSAFFPVQNIALPLEIDCNIAIPISKGSIE